MGLHRFNANISYIAVHGLARKIIGTSPSVSLPSPLHTPYARTASNKVAVAAHCDWIQIHSLSFLPIPAGLAHWDILIGLSLVSGKSRPQRPVWYGMEGLSPKMVRLTSSEDQNVPIVERVLLLFLVLTLSDAVVILK